MMIENSFPHLHLTVADTGKLFCMTNTNGEIERCHRDYLYCLKKSPAMIL